MQNLIDSAKKRGTSLSITVAVVLLVLQIIVPSVLDVVFSALVFGCGYAAGRFGDRG